MRIFNRRSPRIKPLLNIHGNWFFRNSTYPEMLNVAMRDGQVVRYVIDATAVKPHVGRNGWDVGDHRNIVIGYQYKEKVPKKIGAFLRGQKRGRPSNGQAHYK